jgi:hypothetical protein
LRLGAGPKRGSEDFATGPFFLTRRTHPVQDILGKFGPFSFRRLSYTEAQKILARVDSEAKDDA